MTRPREQRGWPGVKPRRTPSRPDEPAFDPEDVVAHIWSNPVEGTGKVSASAPVDVEKVEFMTARAASVRLGTTIEAPDDTLVCLVTLRGSFTVHGPQGISYTSDSGVRVYDAHTGNLLLLGS